ncbi:MAG: hypothetical protein HYV63_28560 [Candidatus Schekmanbacteria bacterium]|nr:hypothetical protein [Candidatus Schekmanbacteria bacterium]
MAIGTELLRSINLLADLREPAPLARYQPTTKGLRVVQAVLEGRPSQATLVIAAYGSGKSLAAGVGGLLVESSHQHSNLVWPLLHRIEGVDAPLAERARERLRSHRGGLVLVLHGHVPNVAAEMWKHAESERHLLESGGPETMTSGLDSRFRGNGGRSGNHGGGGNGDNRELREVLGALVDKAKRAGADRIAVIWDEFGRHLEGLVADGRTADLMAVQDLAEWAARQSAPAATVTLLLHQNLLSYASRLNQAARHGWRKIEGRFATLRFVEDSRELYELIARVVAAARPQAAPASTSALLGTAAARALELGWYRDHADPDSLASLLAEAWPLSPAALYALPLLSARVAQNERTTFSFLDQADLSQPVGLEQLYAYFSEAMRVDTGLGGTHRRWLEAESARSRAADLVERTILATACLLQLGTGGERRRLPRAVLAYAASAGTGLAEPDAEAGIDRLLGRKLLLHRLRSDDISIWHGADIDIRSRLDEEKGRLQADFRLLPFLAKECPPPFCRPLAHNLERGIGRYFGGRYVLASDLLARGARHPALALAPGDDGRLVFAIAETQQLREAVRDCAAGSLTDDPGIVLVVPDRPLEVTEAALELAALVQLQGNEELVGADPLVLPELKELTAVARAHLHRVLAQLTDPARPSATFFARQQAHRIDEAHPVSSLLTALAEARFPHTPRLESELVVRHRLTRPIVNARKKLILAILERTGWASLGLAGMTTPDASIARAVLERPGLYRERAGRWSWAVPEEIADEGLRRVWTRLQSFFALPASAPKPVAALIDELLSPPYGLRRGVLPILFAAALRAFGRALAIRANGAYLPDILASDVEEICKDPARFTVEVLPLTADLKAYLEGIVVELGGGDGAAVGDQELVRDAFDAINAWKAQLPAAALAAEHVGPRTRAMQRALRGYRDPVELLFCLLPAASGARRPSADALAGFREARRSLENVVDGYAAEAIQVIGGTLRVGAKPADDILQRARAWADCFRDGTVAAEKLDLPSRSLLAAARQATSSRHTEVSFARAVSTLLLGRGFEKWDDRTAEQLGQALRAHVDRIESAAIENDRVPPSLAPILEGRIEKLVLQLRNAIGAAATDRLLERLKHQETAP